MQWDMFALWPTMHVPITTTIPNNPVSSKNVKYETAMVLRKYTNEKSVICMVCFHPVPEITNKGMGNYELSHDPGIGYHQGQT